MTYFSYIFVRSRLRYQRCPFVVGGQCRAVVAGHWSKSQVDDTGWRQCSFLLLENTWKAFCPRKDSLIKRVAGSWAWANWGILFCCWERKLRIAQENGQHSCRSKKSVLVELQDNNTVLLNKKFVKHRKSCGVAQQVRSFNQILLVFFSRHNSANNSFDSKQRLTTLLQYLTSADPEPYYDQALISGAHCLPKRQLQAHTQKVQPRLSIHIPSSLLVTTFGQPSSGTG